MYFKLMNNRPELLTGMRELLEERRHQVVTDAQTVNPVLNGGLEMPVEVTMDLTGVEGGREVSVTYSCCEEKGCRKGKAVLRACGKTFLFRALMTLVRELERKGTDDSFEKKETVYLDKNGTMLDCSRNSVLNVETIKKYIRIQAALGMNTMMLYTEDTYEVPEYPYFGAFRGRYTKEELAECDNYAALFGIEMIPCIRRLPI